MFLHIGKGEIVKTQDVIGIFDLDTSSESQVTVSFLQKYEKAGAISYKDEDLPRSFVLIQKKKEKPKIKLSRISSFGLKARTKSSYEEED